MVLISPSLLLTQVEVAQAVAVVGGAGAEHAAGGVAQAAGGVHGRAEHDGARHVAEHADRELDHAHRHRLVCQLYLYLVYGVVVDSMGKLCSFPSGSFITQHAIS